MQTSILLPQLEGGVENIIGSILETHMNKEVLDMYDSLQNSVDTMDKKVEIVMKKHQSEFLYAYRTHIKKIKKELEEIKKKSEQQEKMFSANDRIRYLEKEVIVFREEAIKLYDALKKKAGEIEVYKNRIEQMKETFNKNQAENKDIILKMKRMESTENQYQRVISVLEKKVEEQDEKIKSYEKKLHFKETNKQFMESTKFVNINPEKLMKSPVKQIKTHRNQLQEWFLECIKSVKKEIHQRKNSFQTLDLSKITSISEFKLVDKLRLFQLLLQNQKLLNWFYHRLFPDAMDKINAYLSQVMVSRGLDSEQKKTNSARTANRYGQEDLMLPKVSGPSKRSSSSIRNQITIRNGKMNISMT